MAAYQISSKLKDRFVRNEFWLSHLTVTVNKDQSNLNWYQTIQLGDLYHHTKLESNQSINVKMQANVNIFV